MSDDTCVLFSWRWSICNSGLPPVTRHILITLSIHMDTIGRQCFPSMDRIAEETGLARRSVSKHIKHAQDLGWVKTEKRSTGQGWMRNSYIASWPDNDPAEGGASHDATQCISVQKAGHEMPSNTTENTTENTTVPTAPQSDARRRRKANAYPDDFESFWSAYPDRDGGNPKKKAWRAWQSRIREGVPAQDMTDGAERYAQHCSAHGKAGTPFVMQAATFAGPDERYKDQYPTTEPSDGQANTGSNQGRPQSATERFWQRKSGKVF